METDKVKKELKKELRRVARRLSSPALSDDEEAVLYGAQQALAWVLAPERWLEPSRYTVTAKLARRRR